MKVLALFSGGMDSATLVYQLLDEGHHVETVSFDYGSKHNDREYFSVDMICRKLGIENTRITLPLNKYFKSELLKSGGEIPEGHYKDETMKKTVVPFRNGIMLSIAAGLAESKEMDAVGIANHFGDHAIYPDCRKSFILPMEEAISQGTYKKIKLIAPFSSMDKTDLVFIGDKLGIDHRQTYSCYKGGKNHCGLCSTCYERREAFVIAGVEDPTAYMDKTPFDELQKKYEKK